MQIGILVQNRYNQFTSLRKRSRPYQLKECKFSLELLEELKRMAKLLRCP